MSEYGIRFSALAFCFILCAATIAGRPGMEDAIIEVRPDRDKETGDTLRITVDYFLSETSAPAVLTASILGPGNIRIPGECPSVDIRPGQGKAVLRIRYTGDAESAEGAALSVIMHSRKEGGREIRVRKRVEFVKTWNKAGQPSGKGRAPEASGRKKHKEPSGVPGRSRTFEPSEVSEAVIASARKGETYRIGEDGRIELQPFHIRHFAFWDAGSGCLVLSVDYTCLSEDDSPVTMTAEVLSASHVLRDITAEPVVLHPGFGSAAFECLSDSGRPAAATGVRFAMFREGDAQPLTERTFPLSYKWERSGGGDQRPTRPAFGKTRLRVINIARMSDNEAKITVSYVRAWEEGSDVLTAEVFGDGEKLSGFVFENPRLPGRSGLVTPVLKWRGKPPAEGAEPFHYLEDPGGIEFRRSRSDLLVLTAASSRPTGKEPVTVRVPLNMTWLDPGVFVEGERRVVEGTVETSNLMDGNTTIRGDAGIRYQCQWATVSDGAAFKTGDAVKAVGRIQYQGFRRFFLHECRPHGREITVAGYVDALVHGEGKVRVQEQGRTKSWTCRFENTADILSLAPYDLIEVTGTPALEGAGGLEDCRVAFHCRLAPPPIESFEKYDWRFKATRVPLTELTGWDIFIALRLDQIQAFIDSFYHDNKDRFVVEWGGMKGEISNLKLKFWSMGMDRPSIATWTKLGPYIIDIELGVKFKGSSHPNEKDSFVIDLTEVTSLRIADGSDKPMLETSGKSLDDLAEHIAGRFRGLGEIPIPIRWLEDIFSGLRMARRDGSEYALQNIVWGFETQALDTPDHGFLYAGMGFPLPDRPLKNFGAGVPLMNITFGEIDHIVIAVSNWLVTDRLNYLMKPVKTLNLAGIVPKDSIPGVKDDISIGIIDKWLGIFENATIYFQEVWIDLYKIEGSFLNSGLESDTPTLADPGRRGNRKNTDGVRILGWKIELQMERIEGMRVLGTKAAPGALFTRGEIQADLSDSIPSILTKAFRHLVKPTFDIPGSYLKFTINDVEGDKTELRLRAEIR